MFLDTVPDQQCWIYIWTSNSMGCSPGKAKTSMAPIAPLALRPLITLLLYLYIFRYNGALNYFKTVFGSPLVAIGPLSIYFFSYTG